MEEEAITLELQPRGNTVMMKELEELPRDLDLVQRDLRTRMRGEEVLGKLSGKGWEVETREKNRKLGKVLV